MDRAYSSDSSSDSPPHITGTEDDQDLNENTLLENTTESYVSGFKETFPANLKRQGRPNAFGGGEGAREPKARRKDPRGGPSGSGSLWDAMGGSHQVRQKDELVDGPLMEKLRNQFGDPFDDSVLKKAAGSSA